MVESARISLRIEAPLRRCAGSSLLSLSTNPRVSVDKEQFLLYVLKSYVSTLECQYNTNTIFKKGNDI